MTADHLQLPTPLALFIVSCLRGFKQHLSFKQVLAPSAHFQVTHIESTSLFFLQLENSPSIRYRAVMRCLPAISQSSHTSLCRGSPLLEINSESHSCSTGHCTGMRIQSSTGSLLSSVPTRERTPSTGLNKRHGWHQASAAIALPAQQPKPGHIALSSACFSKSKLSHPWPTTEDPNPPSIVPAHARSLCSL